MAVVTHEQHRAVERLALQVLASIRLTGDLEIERQAAVGALRKTLADVPITAGIHRPTDLHPPAQEEPCSPSTSA